jgi:TRAP-type C4-dicarboxylate transport system substrate-binding protein
MKLANKTACAVLAGLCLAGTGMAQTKAALQVVGNLGITTQSKELEQPFWAKQVPEATGGRITASFKPWNEMGLKGPEVFKMLGQGVFDVGTSQLGFVAGDNAINDATDLAGVSPDIDTFQKVTRAFRPELEKHYEQQKIKVLGLFSYQAQVLFCRNEIKGLADLKGRKVRTSGASQADFVGYFGGSGINMAFGEVQQALQNGVIDCAITGTLGGYKAKWHDGAKYLFALPINWGAGLSGMNMASWRKLDAVTQATLQEQYAKLEKAIYEQNVRENDLGLACNTGGACSEGPAAKMTLVQPTAADVELRKKALVEQVLPRWAQRCGAACMKSWNETVGKVAGLTAAAR